MFFGAAVLAAAAICFLSPGLYANLDHGGRFAAIMIRIFPACGGAAGTAALLLLIGALSGQSGKAPVAVRAEAKQPGMELFAVSFLILFLELALIRWIPAYLKLTSYFTNFIMLASVLGMGLGCIAPRTRINFERAVAPMISLCVVLAIGIFELGNLELVNYSPGGGGSGIIYFGSDIARQSLSARFVNIGVIIGAVFVCVTFVFIGLGQRMGRLFGNFASPITAYTINIGASVAGIVSFSLLSFLGAPPWIWFLAMSALLLWLLWRGGAATVSQGVLLAAIVAGVAFVDNPANGGRIIWSPYYKIRYDYPMINVNEMSHQIIENARDPEFRAYALPHLMARDTGRAPFEDVMVIGAGSGNDVSYALRNGARRVDAVEIDPSIIGIGRSDHPNHPYSDPRVRIINDDGRSFLRETDRKYDLIVYGLVDSLTLMSNFSSVRLENYLFTREAFRDVHRRLKPGGVFVVYNFFRENWLTIRIYDMLQEEFGEPVLILNPPARKLSMKTDSSAGFATFMAGGVAPLRTALEHNDNGYSILPTSSEQAFSGFHPPHGVVAGYIFRTLVDEKSGLRLPTDDWPFVYSKRNEIPSQNILGLAVLAACSFALVAAFAGPAGMKRISLHYFFLGGAFMLLETRGIVKLALIHGSTWFVNSVTFVSILLTILLANLLIARRPLRRAWPVYAALFAALAANYLIPLELFIGKKGFVEDGLSSALLFAPILFAGMIFADSFRRSKRPSLDLGSNLLGVISGGIAEYASLCYGYNSLILLAAAMYAVSLAAYPRK